MQLISYIAPGAPATRRAAEGNEPSLRIELGFTPGWYRQHLYIDFGRRYHTDAAYRRDAVVSMQDLLAEMKESLGQILGPMAGFIFDENAIN